MARKTPKMRLFRTEGVCAHKVWGKNVNTNLVGPKRIQGR